MKIIAIRNGRFAYPNPAMGHIELRRNESITEKIPAAMLEEMVLTEWVRVERDDEPAISEPEPAPEKPEPAEPEPEEEPENPAGETEKKPIAKPRGRPKKSKSE